MVQKTQSHISEVKISWEDYDKDVHKLANAIRDSKAEIHCIYAIPRGGYVLGVHLSHLLNLPMVTNPYGTILVVDDVSDSGKTLKGIIKPSMRTYTATLYTKKGTAYVPDFWIAEYPQDAWLIYPWEV